MSALVIRTNDRVLQRALEGWWAEFAPLATQSQLILTDLDDFPPLGEGEITFSRSKPCHLPRPFSFEELEALIVSRPVKAAKRLILKEGTAFLDGECLHLTPLEHRLLALLEQTDPTHPASAEQLSLALWNEVRPSNQINVYVRYLREKTDLPGRERLIFTIKGKGFYLKNEY